MINLIKIILVSILATNSVYCQQKVFNKYEGIEGHTFLKVIEENSHKIVYEPCYASVETYRFYKDSVYHNWGQEYDIIKGSISKKNNTFLFRGFNDNSQEENEIQVSKLDGSNLFWSINNEIFIDSINITQIEFVKEICKEDLEPEESIKYETVSHVKGLCFATDCESDEYIYFLVGGQFITKSLSLNTRLKKINDSEFNIFFSPPLLDPIPNSFKAIEYYSISKPIARAKHLGNKLVLEWYGFYNRLTQKREFLQNPFTDKIETSPIILKNCAYIN